MRMSCNGCRVLRKGCTEDCALRPCLQWISTAQSQANATLFLSKFYGRAGLINLINASPINLRSETFKSLLYEACGRMVDPVHGSIGLLRSGNWHLCQTAVDSVMSGTPINHQIVSSDQLSVSDFASPSDIRHERNSNNSYGIRKIKCRRGGQFKRPTSNQKIVYESVMSHELELGLGSRDIVGEGGDDVAVETIDLSLAIARSYETEDGIELEVTLGFELS